MSMSFGEEDLQCFYSFICKDEFCEEQYVKNSFKLNLLRFVLFVEFFFLLEKNRGFLNSVWQILEYQWDDNYFFFEF